MIEIINASKSLGNKEVLKNINLKIDKGCIFGLIGQNGAGKTTLIKCLTGMYKVDKGSITIKGEDVFENNFLKNKIAYVCDDNSYFPNHRIIHLVKFYSLAYSSFSKERFNELNNLFKIPLNSKMRSLSKGMKMKVSLMLNLSIMPDILVLDEPTSGIDPIAKKQFRKLLLEEVCDRKTTVFISSHNLGDLERVCDSVAFIENGIIQNFSELDSLKSSVKKLQVVFNDTIPKDIKDWHEILTVKSIGRVTYIITRTYSHALEEKLKEKGALFIDEINLNLEDIFIYLTEENNDYV